MQREFKAMQGREGTGRAEHGRVLASTTTKSTTTTTRPTKKICQIAKFELRVSNPRLSNVELLSYI